MSDTHDYSGFEQLLASGIKPSLILDILGDAILLIASDGFNTQDAGKSTMLKIEALVKLQRAIYQIKADED